MRPKLALTIAIALLCCFSLALAQNPTRRKPSRRRQKRRGRSGSSTSWPGNRSRGTALSPDGQWFAYRLSPAGRRRRSHRPPDQGDEGIQVPGRRSPLRRHRFSDDAKFCGFHDLSHGQGSQGAAQGAKARVNTKAAVLNLATGEKVEYDKIESFAFSRENPGWIALLKNAARKPGAGKGQMVGLRPHPARAGHGQGADLRQRRGIRLR